MPRTLVVPYASDDLPAAASALFGADVLTRWRSADRAARGAELIMVADGDRVLAAALVTARAGTAYLKIVDAAGDLDRLIDALLEQAAARGLVQVKWEGWTIDPARAAELGFAPLRPPLESAIDGAEPLSGYVRWMVDADIAEPAYYRQTESFTCGAVVALMARSDDGFDRSAELALWRTATNFPACEPFGLGVALHRAWPEAGIRIALDVDRPVMIDHLPEPEQRWRAELQTASADEARALGIADDARTSIGEVRAALDAGERVLLLVSLERMQGFAVPHWVLCHAVLPGAIVVEDPWTAAASGDSWVDAHLLPIADAELDAMAALEHDGYRGAVRIG